MLVSEGYFQASVTGTAQTLTQLIGAAIPAKAKFAYIRTETANVRWRDDGTPPTAATGFLMATSDMPIWFEESLTALEFIAVSGSPNQDIMFYR
jgi:hypothetical protein